MRKKILLLGSGELGKEFTIAAQRLGQEIIAVDAYDGAPAQQVAHAREVVSMLDGAALDALVAKHRPDVIVPEIEAIRTERLQAYEAQGVQVVPSARAAAFTMNRRAIRDLAARELGLATARYAYASTPEAFRAAVHEIGLPCVVKPLMSSSGKGQSVVRAEGDLEAAWAYAMSGTRGDLREVIVEEFIPFDSEITLLTVTQRRGETLFCPPIGHRQERGDYQESWQPHPVPPPLLEEARRMAGAVTRALGGAGIFGVEFFLAKDRIWFSELSPRPHDTGMVTLAGTQPLNEFELHLRAVLGLPIPPITLVRPGASAVILARGTGAPVVRGLESALAEPGADVRIFGKPALRPHRRMGVALVSGAPGDDPRALVERARAVAARVSVDP
ncbi:formate-dependent phosphoribosylglycinamide formyltransferase [Anaeromyxobacter dehalogenans]|uniref:Formate-dependent phosphoribosylglycinamide formyltransferase n=1 Tax=Anaeromyxobacter dehalogenans (strain 2CP-C) TaxID=290397 RepID=PURT_ANADE|nr:formate-dependent phosphoribosylglycinamide formyltransferase [Anaeromyxobacter dehalogenans]Q2IJJ5.1 RecName: Full=Formate-dependent phosphoribosylglycinamide formyltransferase; AltName: Full=5'-phosphoribosylglycinamide transformylase 2; AltName: Full=Formate-dependent GAR transformylase; AltName: Full=GAR transformylase 2; Short=GART 2; AltName: Full=Non-folate glycinamide ribonucleotide transformylase; AltName: Full=Phosphoribosylglycinamide formyltransferase 2 [Anaeromyxobacter dehalogenan